MQIYYYNTIYEMTFRHEFITIAEKTYIDVKSKNYLSSNFTDFHKKQK